MYFRDISLPMLRKDSFLLARPPKSLIDYFIRHKMFKTWKSRYQSKQFLNRVPFIFKVLGNSWILSELVGQLSTSEVSFYELIHISQEKRTPIAAPSALSRRLTKVKLCIQPSHYISPPQRPAFLFQIQNNSQERCLTITFPFKFGMLRVKILTSLQKILIT